MLVKSSLVTAGSSALVRYSTTTRSLGCSKSYCGIHAARLFYFFSEDVNVVQVLSNGLCNLMYVQVGYEQQYLSTTTDQSNLF